MIRRRLRGAKARLGRALAALRGKDPALAKINRSLERGDKRLAALDQRVASVGSLAAQVTALRQQVAELEEGLAEQRGLGLRVAELCDTVAGLLAVAARGDRAELEQALEKFTDAL